MNVLQYPCFKADLGGSNQTGMTSGAWTQVTFTNEVYDIGAHFASSAWTPPAGKISLVAKLHGAVALTTGGPVGVAIYKDAALFAYVESMMVANDSGACLAMDDIATGSNVYTMYGLIQGGVGRAFDGQAHMTYFAGHWFSQ